MKSLRANGTTTTVVGSQRNGITVGAGRPKRSRQTLVWNTRPFSTFQMPPLHPLGFKQVVLRNGTLYWTDHFNNNTQNKHYFLFFTGKMWMSLGSTPESVAPSSRTKHSATLLGSHVYLFGGRNGNLPLKDLWRYSISK